MLIASASQEPHSYQAALDYFAGRVQQIALENRPDTALAAHLSRQAIHVQSAFALQSPREACTPALTLCFVSLRFPSAGRSAGEAGCA